jgi:hypothetical protein
MRLQVRRLAGPAGSTLHALASVISAARSGSSSLTTLPSRRRAWTAAQTLFRPQKVMLRIHSSRSPWSTACAAAKSRRCVGRTWTSSGQLNVIATLVRVGGQLIRGPVNTQAGVEDPAVQSRTRRPGRTGHGHD